MPSYPSGRLVTRRRLLVGGAVAVGALAVFQFARSDALGEARRYFARLRRVLLKYADALSVGADTLNAVLLDLQRFLQSDTNEVPASLRQLARLLQSQDVSATAACAVSAVVQGVAGGLQQRSTTPASSSEDSGGSSPRRTATRRHQQAPQPGALDRLIAAALSERGQNLVAVAVSLGARNLVSAFLETQHRLAERSSSGSGPQPDSVDRLFAFLAQPEGQQLVAVATGAFVSHGMRVYMDESMDVNVYEDIFASMAKPAHLEAVRVCVGTFAREAAAAAVVSARGGARPRAQPLPPSRTSSSLEEVPVCASTAGDEQEGATEQQQQQQPPPESPSSSSATRANQSGAWVQSCQDDLDSDSLLHTSSRRLVDNCTKAELLPDSSSSGLAVRSPVGANSPSSHPAPPVVAAQPAVHVTKLQPGQQASGSMPWMVSMRSEWLNAVRDPHGRTVMVELAGTAAKEAARGASGALVERLGASWFMLVACIVFLFSWTCLHLLQALLP